MFKVNDLGFCTLNNRHRSEATWNDAIHDPTLRLASSHIPQVEVENATTFDIEKTCISPARGNLETPGGKMIDYALLLREVEDPKLRITDFVDASPDVKTFNQFMHGPLCQEPSSVFIETKVDMKRQGEGKTHLGLWLAAWFGRFAKFETSRKLRFLPVIPLVHHRWKLHFTFYMGDRTKSKGEWRFGQQEVWDKCINYLLC
ncbi:hypothetical protein ACHAPJ_013245 [Fusarium lateritium]